LYAEYHKNCPKGNFDFRLEAQERALESGMRSANVGALLGLCEFRKDFFFAGLHADFLMRRFPSAEIGVAVPRLNVFGPYIPPFPVTDLNLQQCIVAIRNFLPSAGISLSTRECPQLRDLLVDCGITRLSAGSRTEVGGYAEFEAKTEGQFDVHDTRSVEEIVAMLKAKNYDPVFTDWRRI
ncbi:MAG: 2-iminoacetate synthase ThiH, partial [Candidatus Nanoarchaeia archaeon]